MSYVRTPTVDPTVKVSGATLGEEYMSRLKEVLVESRLDGPDHVQVTFHDHDHQLVDKTAVDIGKDLVIEVEATDVKGQPSRTTLVSAEITALEAGVGPWGSEFVIRGFDKVHRLQRGRKSKPYLNKKYTDIVREIASAHGLRVDVEQTSVVHDVVLQTNETDWELVRRLAREIGFQAGGEGGTLYFRKPPAASSSSPPRDGAPSSDTELKAGHNLHEARLTVNASGQVPQTEVRGWDREKKAAVSQMASAGSVMADVSLTPAKLAKAVNGKPHVVAGTPYRTDSAAQEASKGVAEQMGSAHTELWALAAGQAALRAGKAVTVAGMGQRLSGRYVLTSVRHTITPEEGFLTEVAATGARDYSLLGLTSDGGGERSDRIHGVVPALVTNVKDPKDTGRVKVKFPWLDDNLETDWVPVGQIMAGAGYGALFLPEVNDEVLVTFEHGDVRAPYIVGALYNGKDKPDKKAADLVDGGGKVKTRRLTTRTKQGVVFFDDANKQGLRLRTGDEQLFIDLNQTDTKIAINSNGTVEISGTKDIKIATQANCSFDVKGDFKVKATGKVAIEGTAGVDLKSNATLNVQAQAPLTLKSNATAELSGNAPVTVKSAAILQLQGSLVKIN